MGETRKHLQAVPADTPTASWSEWDAADRANPNSPDRCTDHPGFYADYCPGCGTEPVIA